MTHQIKQHELSKVGFFVFAVAIIGALGVLLFEQHANQDFSSLQQAIWWALVTMTTVGYGDIVPHTVGGRLVGTIIMFSGVGLVSVFTATVSSFIITKRMREGKGLQKLKHKNHILLCGWNYTGEDILSFLADYLIRYQRVVVLVNELSEDEAQSLIQKYQDLGLKYVHGDFTEEAVLRRANVQDAYAAIVIPDASSPTRNKSDERTILGTLSIKAIEPKVKVTAHLVDANNEPHLRRANADKIVVSDRNTGYLLAAHIMTPGVPETVDDLMSLSSGIRLSRRKIPPDFEDKTFLELSKYFKTEDNAILLGFLSEETEVRIEDILSDDYSVIDEFIKRKFQEAGRGLTQKARVGVSLNPPSDYRIKRSDVAVVVETIT